MIEKNKQIKIGAILSYMGVFLGVATGLIYNPWMIAKIGDSDYGLYSLAISLINTFLIDFGLSMASQRFISKYLAEKDQQAVDNITGLIFKLYILITIILLFIFFVLYFFIDSIYVQLTPTELDKFKILYLIVALYSITSFPFVPLNGILSSYEKFIPVKVCDLLYKILSVSLTIIALILGQGVYILVVANLVASLVVTIVRVVSIKKLTPVRVNFAFKDYKEVKSIFSFSIWTSISSVALRLFLTLGPSILGIVCENGTREIAVFGYAVSIEGYIYTFVNAINGFFMPKLSRIATQGDLEQRNEQVLNLMTRVGRVILILFSLVFIGFLVLGKDFINMVVGAAYENAYYIVLLICAYGVIAYTYTIVKNKVKKRALISIISFVIYLGLAFPFSKFWGAIGLGGAICCSLCFQTILMNALYKKDLGISVFKFFYNCHIRMLPGFGIFAVGAFLITSISIVGWIGFITKVFLITIFYMLCVLVFILNKEEKKLIIKKVKRK